MLDKNEIVILGIPPQLPIGNYESFF